MSDMDAVTAAKSDQFNADDLIGGELAVTIEGVTIRPGTEQPITVHLDGYSKVFRPCKTVARIMKAAWGNDSSAYKGRSMLLYCDPGVTWGGMKVGGIRVRAMSHITDPLVVALQEKKGSKKITTVRPMEEVRQPIDDARDAIANAADLDALQRVWKSRAMEPFRETLKPDLDARKAALTANDGTYDPTDNPAAAEKRADTDMSEDTRGGE